MGIVRFNRIENKNDLISSKNILSFRKEYEIFDDSEKIYEAKNDEKSKNFELKPELYEGDSSSLEDGSENIWKRDLSDKYCGEEKENCKFHEDVKLKSDEKYEAKMIKNVKIKQNINVKKCSKEVLKRDQNGRQKYGSEDNHIKKTKKVEKSGYLHCLFGSVSGKSRFLLYIWLASNLNLAAGFPYMNFTVPQQYFDPYKCGCKENPVDSRNFGLMKRARVVGGDEVPSGTAPWLAALTKDSGPHCGATLISKKHLLTAAHCIDGLELSELDAWIGVHSLSQAAAGAGGAKILRAWPHPNFDIFTFTNDIAVLELVEEVTFSSTLRPICLPSRDDAEYSRRTAVVAGWGRTAETKPPSDVPRQAQVQIWGSSRCKNSGYPARRVSGPVLCAGLTKGGVDACQGDSGGPLILPGSEGDIEVIGVVSWGRGCARPNLPGVYTRVASFLPFIHNILVGTCS